MTERLSMVLKTILLVGVFLTLLISMHGMLYVAVVRYFDIASVPIKYALLIVLAGLSISFFSAFFFLHWKENAWTVGFYIFSAAWTGILINLLLGAGLSGIVIFIGKFSGHPVHVKTTAAVCFFLAILFSAYGFWNAFHPKIKHLDVELKDLPDCWQDKTIVQLSDIHLGHLHSTGFLEQVVQKVNTLKPDLVCITGDLFDGMTRRIFHFAPILSRIQSKKGVLFVTGNHEGYIGFQQSLAAIGQTGITVLHNEAIDIEGLRIIGVSYPGVRHIEDIRNSNNPVSDLQEKATCTILMFHTPTNIGRSQKDAFGQHFSTYWLPDISFKMNKALGAQLQLSGHTHGGQLFPFNLLVRFIFKGFHYGLNRAGDFSIYTSSGVGTWGPPMRTGTAPEIVAIHLK